MGCLCFVFVMLSRLFVAASWSPAGKELTFWPLFVMSNCDFVTFPCGILGKMWCLIVLIPDIYHLSYFVSLGSSSSTAHIPVYMCNLSTQVVEIPPRSL